MNTITNPNGHKVVVVWVRFGVQLGLRQAYTGNLLTLRGHPHITSYSCRGVINQHSESRTWPSADTDTDYDPQHASVGRMTTNLSFCLPMHGELSFRLPMHDLDYNECLSLPKTEFNTENEPNRCWVRSWCLTRFTMLIKNAPTWVWRNMRMAPKKKSKKVGFIF